MRALLMTPKKKGGWRPGANTTGYFKFNGDLKDEISGTTYTASGITYGTLPNGNQYAIFPGNSNGRFAYNTNISGGGNELTLHVWFQVANTSNMRTEFSGAQNGYNYYTSFVWEASNIGIYYYNNSKDIWNGGAYNIPSYNINEWHLFSQTIKAGGKIKIFLDGNLGYEKNMEATLRNGGDGGQYIGARRNGSSNYFNGKMSEMIMEKREWTAQEVADYYNQTKSNYGWQPLTKINFPATLNSLQNINLTPTNEINITPNNNGSGTVLDI